MMVRPRAASSPAAGRCTSCSALTGAAGRLRYLQPGLGVILLGVAAKMLLADVWTIPVWASLGFTATVLAVVVAASRLTTVSTRPSPARGRSARSAPAGPPGCS